MNAVYVLGHLGLGDHIICNGLVRVLAKHYDIVYVPAKRHNADTVRWMFGDCPQVSVIPVDGDVDATVIANHVSAKVLRIGIHSGQPIPPQWDKWFYDCAGVPFECRWSEFKLPDCGHELPQNMNPDWVSHWCFIHDDVKRGYRITADRLPPIHEIGNYFAYQGIGMDEHAYEMQRSAEIHVIDSCFLCLADSIETRSKRHVLHLYATTHDPYKKLGPPTLKKNWEILR